MNKRLKWYSLLGVIALSSILLCGWFLNRSEDNPKNIPTQTNEKKKIDQEIKNAHFQGTALLIRQGNIFLQQGYGFADADKKVSNQANTIFPIASLQKIITGAIILKFVQEKKLTLNTTLASFYPEIKYSKTITIRQLLNHTSGIMMPEEEPETLLTNEDSQIDNALKTLTVTQDKEFFYSNGNYTLLAGIISKIAGQSYKEVIQKEVIDKLALKHTYFWDNLPKGEAKVLPYYYIEQDFQEDPFPASEKLFSSLLGAGNMYMSVEDFLTFIKGLSNGQLFKQREYDQLADVKTAGYQAGMIYFDGMKYSEGSLGGYNTAIYGDQNNQNLIILFANQPANDGLRELCERLYEEWLNT
ncbi:serine hydrolase domain-containing protein [Candidatus Enterococcus mansonii]|uniref:Beta-lactamase-related domain-containing protein n=1 Tax=Candidatus Enterococcus mansonii TaxID=1834181 RepID=A0A242CK85_9ENTE|nr:serine hydrolase domain-containing protein [Enterococcus sp. 4G2_DIV0659]OTO10635.1 hypothetical protein A5880_001319 [Enterococcus sp. 4G2_DIV0659]